MRYNSPCVCGRSSSGRARPCQGRGSEFEPRRPLQKEIPHPTGWGISFWKCAAAPENSLPRPARSASNQEVRQGSCEWRQPFVGCREASSSLVARSKKERHPTGCLSFLGNESGEARNELQLRAPRRGVEAGSNSPGDCCVRERRAEPRNRRGIEEYVKEKIYIDGCTHFLPCGGRECEQQNLWAITKRTPHPTGWGVLFGNVPQRRCICAMRRLSNRRWCGKLIKVGRDAP